MPIGEKAKQPAGGEGGITRRERMGWEPALRAKMWFYLAFRSGYNQAVPRVIREPKFQFRKRGEVCAFKESGEWPVTSCKQSREQSGSLGQ